MGVSIYNKTKGSNLKQYYTDLDKIFESCLTTLKVDKEVDVAVILIRSKAIQKLNKQYRNIDKSTDVISFAIQDSEELMLDDTLDIGDIYINVDSVVSQALDYGHSIRREFCFLFIHGLLHCFGYDHMNEKDEKIMFELQNKILDPLVKR